MLDWKTAAENDSMYNTPPCWTIYICGLVFARMLREGGLTAALANNEKASWALGVWGAGGGVSLKCGLGLLPNNEVLGMPNNECFGMWWESWPTMRRRAWRWGLLGAGVAVVVMVSWSEWVSADTAQQRENELVVV